MSNDFCKVLRIVPVRLDQKLSAHSVPRTDVSTGGTSVNNWVRVVISVRCCWRGGLKSAQRYSVLAPRQGSVDHSPARGLAFKEALML